MNRRGFLIASAAPLVIAPVAALAGLSGVAEPFPGVRVCEAPHPDPAARVASLDRYVAFLAHEHREALAERYGHIHETHDDARFWAPIGWFPDHDEIRGHVRGAFPSNRAAAVLRAAGL